MKVGEARALGMKPIEVRRLQIRVARAGEIAQALVVGQDEDDVRAAARERPGSFQGGLRSRLEECQANEKCRQQQGPHLAGWRCFSDPQGTMGLSLQGSSVSLVFLSPEAFQSTIRSVSLAASGPSVLRPRWMSFVRAARSSSAFAGFFS